MNMILPDYFLQYNHFPLQFPLVMAVLFALSLSFHLELIIQFPGLYYSQQLSTDLHTAQLKTLGGKPRRQNVKSGTLHLRRQPMYFILKMVSLTRVYSSRKIFTQN